LKRILKALQRQCNSKTVHSSTYPSKNVVGERKNITIVECVRIMFKGKNLPNSLWDEAISIVVHLQNISSMKFLEHKNPYEPFNGYKPTINHLRDFGSKEFSHIPKENRRKLDAKLVKCIFIDYYADHKYYKMYDSITHKFFASRDIIFNEYANDNCQYDSLQVGMLYLMSMQMMIYNMYSIFVNKALKVQK
jgi:hypothetical protein